MILFNIEEVYQYLKAHGEVYTLRKPGRDLDFRRDFAIRGSWFNPTVRIGYVTIQIVLRDITISEQLEPYVAKSGLDDPIEWLERARELSGEKLNLYYVKITQEGEES